MKKSGSVGSGNSIRLLKEANKYLVFQCIMKEGPLSAEAIGKSTRLSRPTVLNIIHELQDEEIIEKDGYADAGIGRLPALLNLNTSNHFALGIDFEFPAVRMTIANLRGQILVSENFTCPEDIGGQALKEIFYSRVSAFVRDSGIPSEQFEGAGVGISGIIDSATGISIKIERVKEWENVMIVQEMEQLLRMPVLLRNDVHLLGMVEKRLYLPESMENFIYVAVRSGIGSITYQHGRAMRGEKGNAGFIGHTVISPSGPRCCCGSCGCLEAFAGQTAIANSYLACSHERITFHEVLSRAGSGEPLACQVLRDAGFYFGVALANLIKTFEIPDVIIGGSGELENSPFMEAAEAAVREYSTESLCLNICLHNARLREDQYALGGCYLVFEHMFEKPRLSLSLSGIE